MSEGMIIRRGGGGGGFDPTGAILKVVTSAGCTVNVSGTSYSRTQTDAEGFPRSGDANVVEHFFNIPSTAFGTITVTATNTYGTNTKTLTVNTAGKVYEQLCGGLNIIFDSTFALKSGYSIKALASAVDPTEYDPDYHEYKLPNNSATNFFNYYLCYNSEKADIDMTPYESIVVDYRYYSTQSGALSGAFSGIVYDKDNTEAVTGSLLTNQTSLTLSISDKRKNPFSLDLKSHQNSSNKTGLIVTGLKFI